MTCDELSAYHYDPEMKPWSKHRVSLQLKKFRAVPAARKAKITGPWVCNSICSFWISITIPTNWSIHKSKNTYGIGEVLIPSHFHPILKSDLAPCNFFFNTEEHSKGKCLHRMIVERRTWCHMKTLYFYRDRCAKLVVRWRKYVPTNGDYVEKWLHQ